MVFLLSECDRTLPPLCYTQPNLFTNSSCAFYLKLVQNLHCVLVSWRICEQNFELILSKFSVLPLKQFRHPTLYLSTHPRSNTISTSHYVGDTCQANEKGQGHVRPISSSEQFFIVAINTPSPLPHFFYSARPLSSSSFSNPSAAATSSSPVRKSFTASTSSPPYSRRPRKSSLRRRRSRLPPPS